MLEKQIARKQRDYFPPNFRSPKSFLFNFRQKRLNSLPFKMGPGKLLPPRLGAQTEPGFLDVCGFWAVIPFAFHGAGFRIDRPFDD